VRKALERGSFGGFGEIPATHNRPRVVRGLMVSALPKEIAVAGLQAGDCIVAVNGVPVFSCRELLDSLRGAIERGQRSYLLEFFSRGKLQAREFRWMQ
jgi:S1-C subfamily serine protease